MQHTQCNEDISLSQHLQTSGLEYCMEILDWCFCKQTNSSRLVWVQKAVDILSLHWREVCISRVQSQSLAATLMQGQGDVPAKSSPFELIHICFHCIWFNSFSCQNYLDGMVKSVDQVKICCQCCQIPIPINF